MCVRRLLIAAFLLAPAVQPAPVFGQLRVPGDALRDVEQTIQARRVLDSDAELAGENIGVIVRDRVATLWGPAPSAEIAFRAELCLRGMIGLADIHNEIYVSDLLEPSRTVARPVRLTPRSAEFTPLSPPAAKAILEAPIPIVPETTPTANLPPIPPPIAAIPFERDLSAERDQRLADAVRTTLQNNEAFRGIQFSVKEGRVSLKSPSGDRGVLLQAAHTVAQLPHVTGVLVLHKSNPW